MGIELTDKIKQLLSQVPQEIHDQVLSRAWDACCDGEGIGLFGKISFDPWDGLHEKEREEFEFDSVRLLVTMYQDDPNDFDF